MTISADLLRRHVVSALSAQPIPEAADEPPTQREDGVLEFGKHWCVRGDQERGLFASVTDRDDVIEFGLLERDGESAINVLHCTLVLEESDALFHSMSDVNAELNLETRVRPNATLRLDEALRFFVEHLRTAV